MVVGCVQNLPCVSCILLFLLKKIIINVKMYFTLVFVRYAFFCFIITDLKLIRHDDGKQIVQHMQFQAIDILSHVRY